MEPSLEQFPGMSATVIAERVGWERGISVFKERIAEPRPLYLPPDPCQRTDYRPGELASGTCGEQGFLRGGDRN